MLQFEFSLYWLAITCYVAGAILATFSLFRTDETLEKRAFRFGFCGTAPHAAAIISRWYASGHGPYLTKLESLSSSVWIVMIIYLAVTRQRPALKKIAVIIFPSSFLLLGMAMMTSPHVARLPATFHTPWLIVHILFAKLTLAMTLLAVANAACFLFKTKSRDGIFWQTVLRKLPAAQLLDDYSYHCCAIAFICWSISMAAGSIWAYVSWGRYWAWDPIEIWSLISWILFGIYLHARRFFNITGEKAALLILVCFILILLTLFAIPFITGTLHTEYLQ